MSRHTPGPWKWDEEFRDVNAESRPDDLIHGERYWRTLASVEPTRRDGEWQATGRLITAAPELLAALEAIDAWEGDLLLDSAAWEDGLPRFTQAAYDDWMKIQALRAVAIAKVKGETP